MKTITSRHWTLFSIIILFLGAVWIWTSQVSGIDIGGGTAPHIGFTAPDFSLPTTNDNTIALSDLRDHPVLINFWTSWCTPCRAEMPTLQKIYTEYQDRDFMILAVNATDQDDHDKALAFTLEHGLTFPVLFDEDGAVSRLYRINSFPTTLFVNQEGIVQDIIFGGPMSEALLRVNIETLIKEKP